MPLAETDCVFACGQVRQSPARSFFTAEPDGGRGYCRFMPRVSAFYGVVIYMYWNERDHPVAHFHAYHAGRRASVSADGEVLAGGLDPRALIRPGMGRPSPW